MELKDPVSREQTVYAAWLAAGSHIGLALLIVCLLYTSPSPRDA